MATTTSMSAASVRVQEAGDDQVVITCVVPAAVAKDLAWQLETKVVRPVSRPRSGVRGRYRAAYLALIEGIRGSIGN